MTEMFCPLMTRPTQHAYVTSVFVSELCPKCMKIAWCWTQEIDAMKKSDFSDVRAMAVDLEENLHMVLKERGTG